MKRNRNTLLVCGNIDCRATYVLSNREADLSAPIGQPCQECGAQLWFLTDDNPGEPAGFIEGAAVHPDDYYRIIFKQHEANRAYNPRCI